VSSMPSNPSLNPTCARLRLSPANVRDRAGTLGVKRGCAAWQLMS
jgi:hypothetical protein